MRMYALPGVNDPSNPLCEGGALDIRRAILKIATEKGLTLHGHHYTRPGNLLNEQLKYDPKTGEMVEMDDKPNAKTDRISMRHDVHYAVCEGDRKCKNKANRKMVKASDNVPYKERQWGHFLSKNMIEKRQNIGVGAKKLKKPSSEKNWREKLADE